MDEHQKELDELDKVSRILKRSNNILNGLNSAELKFAMEDISRAIALINFRMGKLKNTPNLVKKKKPSNYGLKLIKSEDEINHND